MANTPATITVAADVDVTQIVRVLLICEVPAIDIVETPIWWQLYRAEPYFRMVSEAESFYVDWQDWATPELTRQHFGLVE